ncbi:MAG: EVE domain-containing protein [Kofleriaceae bacterium]|jgi:predicted RNA-binding protein with PUA-like domain|nr:EVE domain-containing protein [Kofleriaceae bacterium]MBP6837305.1 EVE domain-containing protein [Kofleriaceae bacterium]MBP9204310.1 EVE domain-containing protein [Kofleriaceae bacterium]
MSHWLMKSEPDAFGIADLARVKLEPWTGVRNYQARNLMRDQMKVGDQVLFYHSNAEPPGAAGLARVHRTGVVDETQFDPDSKYYDPKARRDAPIWICVEVSYVETFPRLVPLAELRATAGLDDMVLLRRGSRLSVQPVSAAEYKIITRAAARPAPAVLVAPPASKPARRPPAKKASAPARARR